MEKEEKKERFDFEALCQRFTELSKRISGLQAEIKRASSPEDLIEVPAFYRLMAGIGTHAGWQRVAFFLPYAKHKAGAESLGKQLAKAGVSEMRLFQVIRSSSPNDIVQLRRLVQQVKPTVDWQTFGNTLLYWDYDDRNKRNLLEDYFLAANNKNTNKGEVA